MLWDCLLGLLAGLLAAWLALVATMWWIRPEGATITQVLRLLPDVARLIRRLAADRSLPTGVRVRLWLGLAYLAMPIDVIPDFIPVLGYADDVVVVGWLLRSVIRHAGTDAVSRHWPGTAEGLEVIQAMTGVRPHVR